MIKISFDGSHQIWDERSLTFQLVADLLNGGSDLRLEALERVVEPNDVGGEAEDCDKNDDESDVHRYLQCVVLSITAGEAWRNKDLPV